MKASVDEFSFNILCFAVGLSSSVSCLAHLLIVIIGGFW